MAEALTILGIHTCLHTHALGWAPPAMEKAYVRALREVPTTNPLEPREKK